MTSVTAVSDLDRRSTTPAHSVVGPRRGRRRQIPRLTWILQLFPVSMVVLAPYAVLVIPMAVVHDNPQIGFIATLLALALAGTVAVELASLGGAGRRGEWQRGMARSNAGYPQLFRVARLVAMVSIVADLVGASFGHGTIFTQVSGEIAASPAATVSALFSGWRYLAFALLLSSLLGGRASRVACLGWTGGLVGTQTVLVIMTARTAPMIGYLSFVVAVAAICGVLRTRFVVVLILALFLAWPTIFALRNEVRVEGGVAVNEAVSSADRLRFDLQVTRASGYDVPADIDKPDLSQIVRYGVVPRILDPGRPTLSTGVRINEYLGGSSTSAYTFLGLGTMYFLEGPWGIVLFYAAWALIGVLLLRAGGAPGPVRLALFCFATASPLMWLKVYPESLIGFIQFSVAALPVLLLLHLTRQRGGPRAERPAPRPRT
ncbi:hypothetical protein [Verrucosispora sp. WMMD573]|uniref:hypothetical protein n=1 Tax=Verrucosispora sp. WMMD573 TaxID=3015149 RepID=UPI00248AAC48|nr:hypothetical protein [Verrucosispora sp. WMMD573]WBB52100.1 hypothetical protein O7601_15890 [Verrucosispora sp. WMMD573]